MAKTNKKLAKDKAKKVKTPKVPLTPQQQQEKAAVGALGAENMAAGSYLADKFFSPGSMGRISTGIQMNPDGTPAADAQGNPLRVQENAALLNRYQDLSKGMSADQYQAAREQQMKGVQSGLATSMGQLAKAQARGKVYGAAGAAQQANVLTDYQNKVQDVEQQNKLLDVNLIREGTDAYAGALGGMQATERQGMQFNLGQQAAEKAGAAGAYMNTIAAQQGNTLQNKSLEIAKKALGVAGGNKKKKSSGSTTTQVKEPELTIR